MEFFSHKTNIDFMSLRMRMFTAIFSVAIFIGSVVALSVNGLNFGLDFTGGLQVQLQYKQTANITQIRKDLSKIGYPQARVQSYGTSQAVLLSLQLRKHQNRIQFLSDIKTSLPGAKIQAVNFVGPQVGKELATQGALAMVVALIATMIYIAMRFEYRFAASAALALVHDPMLVLGIFAIFHVEFNLPALAAILAVIGYSLNDTIVVFDRVRENFRKMRKADSCEVMDVSINQTLSRTIITSALTLVTVLCLYFLGGEKIHSFSLAMIIGIIIGTYSSIYVAGAFALSMGLSRKDFLPPVRTEIDAAP